MKRRQFTLAAAAGLALPLVPLHGAMAQERGYLELKSPAPTDAPAGKLEVIEFFSYGCIHCMRFSPMLTAWEELAPDDVYLRLVHVGFNQAFEPLQKLYFALEAVGEVDKVHDKVFHALQEDKVRLDKPKVAFDWMGKEGVDADKFKAAYESFGVATKVRQAIDLQEAYRVEGTPALGILGRYYTDGSMARGFDRMLSITDRLLDEARKSA